MVIPSYLFVFYECPLVVNSFLHDTYKIVLIRSDGKILFFVRDRTKDKHGKAASHLLHHYNFPLQISKSHNLLFLDFRVEITKAIFFLLSSSDWRLNSMYQKPHKVFQNSKLINVPTDKKFVRKLRI